VHHAQTQVVSPVLCRNQFHRFNVQQAATPHRVRGQLWVFHATGGARRSGIAKERRQFNQLARSIVAYQVELTVGPWYQVALEVANVKFGGLVFDGQVDLAVLVVLERHIVRVLVRPSKGRRVSAGSLGHDYDEWTTTVIDRASGFLWELLEYDGTAAGLKNKSTVQ